MTSHYTSYSVLIDFDDGASSLSSRDDEGNEENDANTCPCNANVTHNVSRYEFYVNKKTLLRVFLFVGVTLFADLCRVGLQLQRAQHTSISSTTD